MARTTNRDSHLELDLQMLPAAAPGDPAAKPKTIPVLAMESRGPLPHLPPVGGWPSSGPRSVRAPAVGRPPRPDAGGLWLEGDVVMCACPDCHAPMTVRLWLMTADCWRCQASIELTEQQEREVRRLLEQRDRGRPAPTAAPAGAPRQASPQRPPAAASGRIERPPLAAPPRAGAATTSARRTPGRVAPGQRGRVDGLRDWLANLPAWLVSLVFHIVVLTFLGLLAPSDEDGPYIRLSAKIVRDVRQGGDTRMVVPDQDSEFDLGVPDDIDLDDPAERRAMTRADQDARELRLVDPADPHLPDLDQLKQWIRSAPAPTRMLATRDPRLRVELVQREGGTTLTEAAVARGLLWLKRHQNPDGSWSLDRFHQAASCRCGGRGSLRSDHAGTALALLPFLGAGQTHLTGIYQAEVARGLRWLVQQQKPDGDLRGNMDQYPGMYAHGQAAIVLCEAFLMTGDEQLRIPAQRAIDFIVAAQYLDGGWRYFPRRRSVQIRGDTSVLGWQLMALQSALAANLDVPSATMENASHFLDGVQHEGGSRYSYLFNGQPSPAMTAEGLLCRIYLGWKRNHPALREGIDWLVTTEPPRSRATDIYYWYYATQAIHHYGGPRWEEWNLQMRDVLVGSQETRGHAAGSWAPTGPLTDKGGRLYMTSLAICCLEVYYRHLPLFRQLELD
jgi:hypothetical protein